MKITFSDITLPKRGAIAASQGDRNNESHGDQLYEDVSRDGPHNDLYP